MKNYALSCDYYYNWIALSKWATPVWSKMKSCALIVDILWNAFDFYVCYNFSVHSIVLEVCVVPDACAPHKVRVTMCTFPSFSYHLRDCDYFYFFMPSNEWVHHLAIHLFSFCSMLIFVLRLNLSWYISFHYFRRHFHFKHNEYFCARISWLSN